MKMSQSLLLLVGGLLVGLCCSNVTEPDAHAQGIPNAVPAPRFQISAWAYPGHAGSATPDHGCYIVDTVTGELWKAAADGKVIKIGEKVR